MTHKNAITEARDVRQLTLNEVANLIREKIEIFKSPEYAYPDGCLNSIVVAKGLLRDIEALSEPEKAEN